MTATKLTAVMYQTVGDHEIRYLEHRIITPCLVEGSLGDGHLWRLAFQQEEWSPLGVEDQGIGPLGPSVQREPVFNSDAAGRVTEVMHQVVQEMLAHPFLGRCGHPPSAKGVEEGNGARIVLKFDPMVG